MSKIPIFLIVALICVSFASALRPTHSADALTTGTMNGTLNIADTTSGNVLVSLGFVEPDTLLKYALYSQEGVIRGYDFFAENQISSKKLSSDEICDETGRCAKVSKLLDLLGLQSSLVTILPLKMFPNKTILQYPFNSFKGEMSFFNQGCAALTVNAETNIFCFGGTTYGTYTANDCNTGLPVSVTTYVNAKSIQQFKVGQNMTNITPASFIPKRATSCVPMGSDIYCFGGYRILTSNPNCPDGTSIGTISKFSMTDLNNPSTISYTEHYSNISRDGGKTVIPLYAISCVQYDDKNIYCFGGQRSTTYYTLYGYTPQSPYNLVANSLQVFRYNVDDKKTYFLPSANTTGPYANLNIGNAGINARHGLSCAKASNNKIYCFGGVFTDAGYTTSYYLNQIVEFDPTINAANTNMVKFVQSLPDNTGKNWMSCTSLAGKIYCLGGSPLTNRIYEFESAGNALNARIWDDVLPRATTLLSCTPLSGNIYCFGGYTGVYINQILEIAVSGPMS